MDNELVKILDGNTFVVSDARGDIEATPTDPMGLFSFDIRFLSEWVLTIDGNASTRSRPTTCSTSRRASPRSRDRHGVRQREAVGDSRARGGERILGTVDDPQP